jgi:hypothetical protein
MENSSPAGPIRPIVTKARTRHPTNTPKKIKGVLRFFGPFTNISQLSFIKTSHLPDNVSMIILTFSKDHFNSKKQKRINQGVIVLKTY